LGEIDGKTVLEDLGINVSILKWMLKEMGWGSTDSIVFAHDRDRWQELVNGVMNFRIPASVVCSEALLAVSP
jgi:hypothetical protein